MADFSQTITNELPLYGISPAEAWGVMNWGENWANDEDVITEVDMITGGNTLVLTDAIAGKDAEHLIGETLVMTDEYPKDFVREPVSNTMVFTDSMDEITRGYGIWLYLFTRPTDEVDDAVYDQFTKV